MVPSRIRPSFRAAFLFGGHMTLEEIRKAVEQSSSTTQMAWAFRKALGIEQVAPRLRTHTKRHYEKLMHQRYGVLIR